MTTLRPLTSLLVRAYASSSRPTGQIPAVSVIALNHSKILHTLQKERTSEVRRVTPETFTKHKLRRYHYIRPIVQSTVASAAIFTSAGLAHVLMDDPKKKDSVNRVTEYSLIAMNTLVLGRWRLKGLRHFMETHFTHRVESGRCITLLSAYFSHQNVPLHFIPNMAMLYLHLGAAQELSNRHEITAVYLSSGIFGSAASHVDRLAQYRIYNQRLIPSLGASGALMGIMAVAYLWFDPKTHQEKIGAYKDVFVSQMVADLIVIICRWGVIDHAAHLGGAIFGYLYALYGHDYIWHLLVATLRKLLHRE